MKKTRLLLVILLCVVNSFSQTVIGTYNFETGLQNWTVGGGDAGTSASNTCTGSSGSVYVRDNSSTSILTSPNFNLSGYKSVTFSFCYQSAGLNVDEGFNLQYYNGTSWSTVKSYKLGTDFSRNNTAYNFSYFLKKCNTSFPSIANFRFSGTGDSNSQINYFDNVLITGYTNDINILGNGNSILNGDALPTILDDTDFGSVNISSSLIHVFTIENFGSSTLNLTGSSIVSISGDPSFTVFAQPSGATISACANQTFSVKYNPTVVNGLQTAIISIANNDANENPYTFTVQGQAQQNFFDSDGDGIFDNVDIDDDNDGIRDDLEEGNCRLLNGKSVTYKFLNETFGAGSRTTINTTYAATTTYIYEPGPGGNLDDGAYTVGSTAQIASWAAAYWYMGGDHTPGDTNGRMAMFNADTTPGIFYTATITGVLPNIPITYSFWVINLDRTDASQVPQRALPNIKVEFRDLSNNLLATVNTGDIALTNAGNLAGDWHNFTANLNLPVSDFKVIFINNKAGGIGNDLAIDDIEIKQTLCDTDGDGVPDIFDLDSDNDGIPDVVEAGFGYLSEGRGTLTGCATWVDANGNGMHDLTEGSTPFDTDLDGVPNYLDLDSDNDSVFDVDESGAGNSGNVNFQNGDGDINGDGVGDGPESELFRNKDTNGDGILEQFGDGILDIYDYGKGINQYGNMGQGLTGTGWKDYVKDTDNDGTPDYMDTKSNGTTFDISGTLYAHLDANNDGLIDGTADVDRDGILDAFDTNTSVFGSPRNLDRKLHLYFDGRNDYIEEDNGTNIVNGLSEATMMAWIKLDPSFSKDGAVMGQSNFWMRINGSRRLRVEIPDTKPFTTPTITALSLNKWTHVAAVFNGTDAYEKVKLYINGEKVAGTNPAGLGLTIPTSSNTKFRIGRAPSNGDIYLYPATADMFKGEMDEVRVFDKALSEDELQKMVYQEIEENSGNVRGFVIPRDVTNYVNAATIPTILPWNNLIRYYRMDVYKDDIVDNLTTPTIDLGTGAKMYNFKNIYPQTAPLPYETKANGDWSNTATWLHGGVWDIASEATNKDWAIVHIKNNVTTSNRHSTSGLIIDSAKKLSIKTSKELKNTWYLELDGVIDLEDESQLVQTAESILDHDSGGFIERDQQGTANSYNYNYWSSSVGPISGTSSRGTGAASTNASHKLVDILMDGTIAAEPNKKGVINFQPAHWSADNGVTSPIIISSYWLYTFNGTDNNYGAWKSIKENTLLFAGEGFTMKGTSGAVNIGNLQNYVFKGKPNNGDFTLPILKGNDRLIGNPYPSAMDADEFIKDNIKETINSKAGRNTKNIFNGALYFWDHFGERNSHYLKEYVGGYATYTLMGGVKSISNDIRINTTSGLLSSKKPQQFIPVNQGFFVIAALELNPVLTNTTTEIEGGDIVFKNSQRIFMTEASGNSVFMKGKNDKAVHTSIEKVKDSSEIIEKLDKRPKIWLQFNSPTGYHRQLLVGVDENASNFFDLGYDAPIADIGKEDMFWTFDGGKFVIQAVNNFNTDQELPLGIKVSKAGLARIKIDELTNMDENISIHIKDKLTGEMHNISRKPFEIGLEAGAYADRFSLTFKMHKLVAEDVIAETLLAAELPPIIEGIHIFMDNALRELQIKNNSTEEITGITLYNYLGQTIETWNNNLNRRTISLPIKMATGVYFVRISNKNKIVVKKIVIQ